MSSGKVLIEAAQHLEPFQQGDGSGLCGLYSILNAYQLAIWPHARITPSKLADLIHRAGKIVKMPIQDMIGRGMDEETWIQLCSSLVEEANAVSGAKVRSSFLLRKAPERSWKGSLAAIKEHVKMGYPVLVMLWGNYDHATAKCMLPTEANPVRGRKRDQLKVADYVVATWLLQVPSP